MDRIIQLIIIVVIFASIVKRMQQVAQKGEELEAPPPVSPPVTPPMVKRLQDVFQELSGERVEQEVMEEKPVTDTGDFRERQTEFPESVVEETLPIPEDVLQPVSYRDVGIPKAKQKQEIKLGFKGPEVVRGIIMSEILGPPVSMR